MYDHNLDDLIIDNIEPKHNKTKSFLTIIALLIVVMIVAIILTKILLKTPNNNDMAFEEDVSEMIAPELKLKERAKKPETNQEPTVSRMIENEPEAPAEETKKPIKENTVVIQEENSEPAVGLPVTSKVAETEKEPELSNIAEEEMKAPAAEPQAADKEKNDAAELADSESVQEERKTEEKSVEEKTEEVVQKAPTVAKQREVKKAPLPSTPRPAAKPKVSTSEPTAVSTGKYYIQVGAYSHAPDPRFISVIRNNAYQYSTAKAGPDGLTKILIGPYKDNASAIRALQGVKDRINKRAFIVTR